MLRVLTSDYFLVLLSLFDFYPTGQDVSISLNGCRGMRRITEKGCRIRFVAGEKYQHQSARIRGAMHLQDVICGFPPPCSKLSSLLARYTLLSFGTIFLCTRYGCQYPCSCELPLRGATRTRLQAYGLRDSGTTLTNHRKRCLEDQEPYPVVQNQAIPRKICIYYLHYTAWEAFGRY